MTPFAEYLGEIAKNLPPGDATEHTQRPALKKLLEAVGDGIVATNEPTSILCCAPDFNIIRGEILLGRIVVTKDIGEKLAAMEKGKGLNGEQLSRYRYGLPNWILTNYLELRWYVNGKNRKTVRLAKLDAGKLKPCKNGEIELANLLNTFFAQKCVTVLKDTDLELFQHNGVIMQHRITLQNKCVEMSVTVTSGLAAAVVGAAIKFMPYSALQDASAMLQKIGALPIGIVLALYVFIQLSLLTNYIYQTISILAFDYVYGGIMLRSASKFIPKGAPLKRFKTSCGWAVTCFQPAVLYLSTFIGLRVLNDYCFRNV